MVQNNIYYLNKTYQNLSNIFKENPVDTVELFFITSTKSKNRNKYSAYRAPLELGVTPGTLYNIGENTLKKYDLYKKDNKLIFTEYSVYANKEDDTSDEGELTYIFSDEDGKGVHSIPNYDEILTQLKSGELDEFDHDNQKPWAYIIRIKIDNDCIYLFRKATKQTLIGDDDFILNKEGGKYNYFPHILVSLSRYADCIVMDDIMFIFDKNNFESIFRYNDYYVQYIEERIEHLVGMNLVHDELGLVEMCKTDLRKVRRLKRVLDKKSYQNYTHDNLIDTINTYNLNINLDDESGKMIVTSKNIYQVLSVLEDYCALSHINKNRMVISAAQTVKRE